jgi:hypothetical protein
MAVIVGPLVGETEPVGCAESEGAAEGEALGSGVGDSDGRLVGATEGCAERVGLSDGDKVGFPEGAMLGLAEGSRETLGASDGGDETDGAALTVGAAVGTRFGSLSGLGTLGTLASHHPPLSLSGSFGGVLQETFDIVIGYRMFRPSTPKQQRQRNLKSGGHGGSFGHCQGGSQILV